MQNSSLSRTRHPLRGLNGQPLRRSDQTAEGRPLVTLRDAAAYILKLPKLAQQSPEWQAAGEAVIMAAEDRGPPMYAHVGTMLALHGAKPIPEAGPSKTHRGRRKLKRNA
jgi:hypothetical protein